MSAESRPCAVVVLDTNTVLDCWLFQDPAAQRLRQAVEAREVRWQGTDATLDELTFVLARPLAARWEPQRKHLLSLDWRQWLHVANPPAGPPHGLRCTDPDDQKFLDLALQAKAAWLVTRDRALLRLRRRARALTLAIVEPGDWLNPPGPTRPLDLPAK